MKKLTIGILAHVDAGKTTLSEGILYQCGKIGKLGRVDNKDAYLDTFELERARGITIFSKQAIFEFGDLQITLLDTPGHVDFSAEMERTLQVLDYAILVISGADKVQAHTLTLWRLLELYQIPVFLFVNKMDQMGTDKEMIMIDLKKQLEDACIEFTVENKDNFYEQVAICEETMLEEFLEIGKITTSHIQKAIRERKVFPTYFGSALKLNGIEQLLEGIQTFSTIPSYPQEFGAKVFKITRDEQGNRLTHLKLTGGVLKVKDIFKNKHWEEKINQIRLYSGQKFEAVTELEAGSICTVTGLTQTLPGEGFGIEQATQAPILEPVLTYRILLPEGCDPKMMLPKLRQIEEEEPELHIVWDELLQEIQAGLMGEVQMEVLQSRILSRFGIKIDFDAGRIVYKETIANTVEGVGHFEPLRHYAEVHLLLEPGEQGSGLQFELNCSEDILGKSWQRLILTHLEEKVHKGVLTGSVITDMKISLVSGRAHNKHTEGGDFREATYRAVRQGLMEAKSVLLEPYYSFRLELPEKMVGRAMTDVEKMSGISEITHTDGETAVLTGSAPVITMRNYQKEVIAYTKGLGRLVCTIKGYEPCHNALEIIENIGYDPEHDRENPTNSVFCTHGAGFLVPWNEVKNYMHLEGYFKVKESPPQDIAIIKPIEVEERWISLEEIDHIINRTAYANQGKKSIWKKTRTTHESYYTSGPTTSTPKETKEEYLLVDGYNIIFAWPELAELADENMDGAKISLLETLSNYQAIRKCQVIVVFDAYRVQGYAEEVINYQNIHMVYTREAQTADQYIERFAQDNKKKYNITVATSDGLQQIIIRGTGSYIMSAKDLKIDIQNAKERIKQQYEAMKGTNRNYLLDSLSAQEKEKLKVLLELEDENKEKGR